ncbi:MAG: hypothetical protein N3G75_01700 [Methanothrix sp.]|nr:hypothetical protein [Methanothrix sp.]MCX8206533.1 hypothetical protein [Methanothrix sp.]
MRRMIVLAIVASLMLSPALSIPKVVEKDISKSELEELEELFSGRQESQAKAQASTTPEASEYSDYSGYVSTDRTSINMIYSPPYIGDLVNNTLFSELSKLMNVSISSPYISLNLTAPRTTYKIRHVIS